MEPENEEPLATPQTTPGDVGFANEAGQSAKVEAGVVDTKIADLLSDLLGEMKENNRLLRALGAGKTNTDELVAGTASQPIQPPETQNDAEVEEQSKTPETLPPTKLTEDETKLKGTIISHIDHFTKAVANLDEERAAALCKTLFQHMHRPFTWDRNLRQRRSDVSVWLKEKTGTGLTRLLWAHHRVPGYTDEIHKRHLTSYGDQWNLKPAARMVTEGWRIMMRKETNVEWMPMYGTTLVSCHLDKGALRPAADAFRLLTQTPTAGESGNVLSDITCFGSFWVFSMRARQLIGPPPRHVSLDYLSLICTVMVAMGMDNTVAVRFVRSFFEGLPASPRQSLSVSLRAPHHNCLLRTARSGWRRCQQGQQLTDHDGARGCHDGRSQRQPP
ncbi:hypothetical protein B0T16DRAFT_998 [Cercophora newfieldiana]|uniref:Uncharacterized protein n=1 Tax=Cercophora newfieldiana TaxID=92897 RepID=A0AA39YLY9_9PEZI|nr:hypothetical protein B0T16DRAFT_998 [Cercophora newfieldiana]